ncbi:hypothetical protein [Candidatus Sororendozoicomonas aggregata]|uniref:hypothetical protein n=1 Tax=Candidatus Sororendozoicomonas aggregata TaxID=3073239 RepID=UPI002ED36C13
MPKKTNQIKKVCSYDQGKKNSFQAQAKLRLSQVDGMLNIFDAAHQKRPPTEEERLVIQLLINFKAWFKTYNSIS